MGKKIQCIGRYVMNGLTLGKGNFARVELATHGVTGVKVAIKIIETRKIKEEYTKANLHREARILGQVRHPHIVRLYETLKATSLYCLVLEYIPGSDLQTYIRSQKEARLSESKARSFFRQLVSAIHFLHERGVAHRDLKMENILLDEKHKNLKVLDFGLSNTFNKDDLMKTPCGTLEYAAPELISNDKYGPEVDIWSLGIILYGMVIGKLPFSTHYTDQYRRQKLLVQIQKGLVDSHVKELILHAITQDLIELLKKLLEPSVALRLPLLDCETHPWLTCGQKLPFVPFSSLPKDKTAKTQVIEEMAGLLQIPKEQIEKTVHETKCDDLSAMFNMMLDTKRYEKGIYELDFTQKQEVKKERHRKRHHHSSKHASKNTPSIQCTELEASDHDDLKVPHSMNSTRFDLMAVCSAPTWLGGHKRKSVNRRRKSPIPPNSPFPINFDAPKSADGEMAIAAAGQEHGNLLSPSQASTQVSQLLRRNSSRRRPRRTSSADPPSRQGSISRRRRNRPGTPSTGPHSPHSPTNLNNPEIKIITPKQSPVAAVKRPANLGLKEFYNTNHSKEFTETDIDSKLTRHNTLGPNTFSSRRRKFGVDHRDGSYCVHSDSSNPCSSTNLHDDFSDDSQEMLSRLDFPLDSRTSLVGQQDTNAQEQSVESKIAAADIRSIVRPKQYVLQGKLNGAPGKNTNNLNVPKTADENHTANHSPEIVVESMQSKSYLNPSDELDCHLGCDTLNCHGTNAVDHVQIENAMPELVSTSIHSSSKLFRTPSMKFDHTHIDNCSVENLYDGNVCSGGDMYTDLDFAKGQEAESVKLQSICGSDKALTEKDEPGHLIADLYSKREKISLEEKTIMQDEIFYADSSDHNSSQEYILSGGRRHLKESVTSDENGSVSAPILLSPREIGLTLNSGEEQGELPNRSKLNSVIRHGSTPSFRFVMPSTPIRQMFRTPIARIESFHSDDFEIFTSDVDALVLSPSPSPSPKSIQTPTVPCFQYKLHSRRKKGLLGKSSKKQCKFDKDGPKYAKDSIAKADLVTYLPEKPINTDIRHGDPLMSSSSECGSDGQVHDGDKALNASRAKIYPMERDDEQQDIKIGKITSHINDRTKLISEENSNQNSTSKKYQIKSCKKPCVTKKSPECEHKKSAWRRGFSHLLKKKKFVNGNTGNNNNEDDNPSRNRTSNNHTPPDYTATNNRPLRNGHARGTMRVTPPNTLSLSIKNDDSNWSQTRIVQNQVQTNTLAGQ